MRRMEGYTNFSMSYRDMAIVNMAIMENIRWNGNKIEIAGKPVYEVYLEFPDDVKENILKLIRLAYAREVFNVIDRVWDRMKMERSMINYPSGYWLSQVAMVKKPKISKEIKERLDFLEEAEHALCLKNMLPNRMEKVLALWNAAFKSIGISYKNEMITYEEMIRLRAWKEEAARLNYSREVSELQLSMCGILHYNMQNATFLQVIEMVEA